MESEIDARQGYIYRHSHFKSSDHIITRVYWVHIYIYDHVNRVMEIRVQITRNP